MRTETVNGVMGRDSGIEYEYEHKMRDCLIIVTLLVKAVNHLLDQLIDIIIIVIVEIVIIVLMMMMIIIIIVVIIILGIQTKYNNI